jgi:selenocysteine-specific elongation factor
VKVIGTAGHVDHGKSTLVQALTGIDPDRLEEEQKRQMTIDLGFAWMRLPNGEVVGIIDVPGHRDFIENMLAGVGGIDAVLFVIAADEGIMPQTREHLAIIDLLQVQKGVIALTKIDLVTDPEWIPLVTDEIRKNVHGTVLEEAGIIPVSARTKEGIDELKHALQDVLQRTPPRQDTGRPRLPIDRVFTITGFGTVVTGTLDQGCLHVGDMVEILPKAVRGRIRGLQSYKEQTNLLVPGTRAAVNVAGIDVTQIDRGDTLTLLGQYQTTTRLDAQVQLLQDSTTSLKHNDTVKVFLGTSEIMSRVRVLESEKIDPGQTGLIQMELGAEMVAERGDRFIIRRPSPGETLGGGVVIEAHPARTHKRFDSKIIAQLNSVLGASSEDMLLHALDQSGMQSVEDLARNTGMPTSEILIMLQEQANNGSVVIYGPAGDPLKSHSMVSTRAYFLRVGKQIQDELENFHKENPLQTGMMKEELRSRLHLDARQFNLIVVKEIQERIVVEEKAFVRLFTHTVQFSTEEEKKIEKVSNLMERTPSSPPSIKEMKEILGESLFRALTRSGQIIPVNDEVAFSCQGLKTMKQKVVDLLREKDRITVAEVRDLLGTSRKYALAILEYFDTIGVTRREGDYRILLHADR